MTRIQSFEDLARALKRFEELLGAPEGSAEARELGHISMGLRAFEDEVAAKIAAQKLSVRSLLTSMPSTCPEPANLPKRKA